MFASLLAPLQSVPEIATDDRFSEMLKFFAIAVVIVGPACWITWRRAAKRAARLRGEAAAEGSTDEEVAPVDTQPDPHDVKTVVAAIDRTARSLTDGESADVAVPNGLTLDGSAVATALADALIGDAIARNRVRASWATGADGRVVTLTR